MKKQVVLFNIDTNTYLSNIEPLEVNKDWEEAIASNNENEAKKILLNFNKLLKENNLTTWCTRTFYKL